MSWFGETFGDSLNSLKGQITKITKEVLAEDENENENEEPGSVKLNLKELEELCASQDLEINSLREENVKISERFQEELKLLRNENKRLKTDCKKIDDGNSLFSDDQIREICELENQLQQLQIERDHLEELQKDHHSNICLVAQQRDNYKQELEKLKGAHSALEVKYEELLKSKDDEKGGNYLSDINLTENQIKQDELINLKEVIEKLQAQIELCQNEKEEMAKATERLEFNCENFRDKTEGLMEDVRILGEEKRRVESENEELKHTINSITSDLNNKVDDLKVEKKMRGEVEGKVRELTQTLESVKIEQTNFQKNLESQVKKLANIFFPDECDDKYSDISMPSLLTEIETFWRNISAEKEINDKIYAETLNQLENDIKSLRNTKCELEREIQVEMDKKNELECNYKKEINLLQSKYLKLKSEEQECIIKSQTDDVKRLNQEVSKLMEVIESKNNEMSDCYKKLNSVTQELNTLRTMSVNTEHELFKLASEREGFDKSLMELKSDLESKEREIKELMNSGNVCREKCKILEDDNALLSQKNNLLQDQVNEAVEKNKCLEDNINSLQKIANRSPALEKELQDTVQSKLELEKICAEMQKTKLNRDKEWENLKAQLIIKESTVSEQNKKIQDLTRELDQSKDNIVKLRAVEEELNKCKEVMIEMEMQRQELSDENELIKSECASLKSQVSNMRENDVEVERLKSENINLKEACNKLEMEVKMKTENETLKVENENINGENPEIISSLQSENYSLRSYVQQQTNIITAITYENNELKHQLQLANENVIKLNVEMDQLKREDRINDESTNSVPNTEEKENSLQLHRRNKSDLDTVEDVHTNALRLELEKLKEVSQRQIDEYRTLQEQFNVIVDKEAHSKKELERLRLHLIETENYYVETIDEYKAKLSAAEEQLKNSSSFYTSNKVRDNQHLESLQSQIRLMSAQRDSLQEQLSTAQDEIQKQKAALVSFHVVLEQFQQDKERECESVAAKYQNQLAVSDKRFAELQQEKESLNVQLLDAKNGLKAASRLGEQLEKKNEYIADLEEKVAKMQADVKELEETAKLVNKSDADKVDKSLLKNLLLGYISSQKADRKDQVLRIMMSVLDFDEEERNKTGIDSAHSGWLSSLLHPKGDGMSSSQSLSEAFIRFLENESRPQPQLKLLPEHASIVDKSKSRSATPKPSLLLQELVLPTFNSPQSSETAILKDVLKNT